MPVIAIVNRKGGSGKSTLATHLAAYCANAGMSVMLGDVDRQQSTQTWLRLRAAHRSKARQNIVGWAVEPGRGLHAPAGTTHVILDTPGGLNGFDLARVVMFADAVLMPVCNSVFDRESAAACHAELMKLPRVASGRCKIAAVGMRLDARTRSADVLRDWAQALQLPFIGVLRDTQAYVRCIETGMSLFDLPAAQVQADLLQWGAILRWLAPVLHPEVHKVVPAPPVLSGARPMAVSAAMAAVAGPAETTAPAALTSTTTPSGDTADAALAVVPPLSLAPLVPQEVLAEQISLTPSSGLVAASSAAPRAEDTVGVAAATVGSAFGPMRLPPVDEPPVLTSVVQPVARPRVNNLPTRQLPVPPPSLAMRMRGLLDLGPMLKRVQRSAWE